MRGVWYQGLVPYRVETLSEISIPKTRTKIMLIVGDPERAFDFAGIPNEGVGLARIEFIITNHIGIHPMALAKLAAIRDAKVLGQIRDRIGSEDGKEFFIRNLSEGIGRIAAAFYPRPVIVRLSDFKTNEYANLLGGAEFEQHEENPMIGFRGASRYYDDRYAPGFALECAARARVRSSFGLSNVKVMVPFCRTVEEAKKVISEMAQNGLKQGEQGLVYAMCEIPANVVLAEQFLKVFQREAGRSPLRRREFRLETQLPPATACFPAIDLQVT